MSPVVRAGTVAAISATNRCPSIESSTLGSPAASGAATSTSASAPARMTRKVSRSAELIRGPCEMKSHLQFILLALALERRLHGGAAVLRREHGDELVDEAAGVDAAAQRQARGARREQVARIEL